MKNSLSSDDYDTFLDNMVEVRSSFRKKDIATFSEKLSFVKALLTSKNPHLRLAFDQHFPMTDPSVARNILELRISDEGRLQYNQWFEHSMLQIERQRKLEVAPPPPAAATIDMSAQQAHKVGMMQWLAQTEARKVQQQQQPRGGHTHMPSSALAVPQPPYSQASAPMLTPSGYYPHPPSYLPYTSGRAAGYVEIPKRSAQEPVPSNRHKRSRRSQLSPSLAETVAARPAASLPESGSSHTGEPGGNANTQDSPGGEDKGIAGSMPDGVTGGLGEREGDVDLSSDVCGSPLLTPSHVSPAMVIEGGFSTISGLASGLHTFSGNTDVQGILQSMLPPLAPPQPVSVASVLPLVQMTSSSGAKGQRTVYTRPGHTPRGEASEGCGGA